MRQFKGLYHGVAPTDESAGAFGEIEVLVDDTHIARRHAGGLYMDYGIDKITDFEVIPPEILAPGHGASVQEVCVGYKYKGDGIGGAQHIFITKPGLGPDLIIRCWLGDFLGPTMLWRADRRLALLAIKTYIRWCDWRTNGGIPLISRSGLTARHT